MAKREYTVKLYGGMVCDYAYFVSDDLNSIQQNAFDNDLPCPVWDINTEFSIGFNNDLIAGNSAYGDSPPDEFNIYRKYGNEATYKLICNVGSDKRSIIDYGVANRSQYQYLIAPSTQDVIGTQIETGTIVTEFDSWALLVVDDTDDENLFTLSQIYYFDINPEDVAIQNNSQVNKLRGFTRYLKLQRDDVNCLSFNLSSLLGMFDLTTGEYYEDSNMLALFSAISTDSRSKFLRDLSGNIYKVDISSAIEFNQSQYFGKVLTNKRLELTEVDDASNYSIVDGDSIG